ncbi:GGDEF domain-containing protein [Alicyclobacillus curvatus]|nr:GGDEF domain-containing protein [Alicyclobacillus curvatus]
MSDRPNYSGITFDTSIYRFVMFGIIASLFAMSAHLFIIVRFEPIDSWRYAGTRLGIALSIALLVVLLLRPRWLRPVIIIQYVYVSVGITSKLIYLMFWNHTGMTAELLVAMPWMSIDFVWAFLIFRRRVAAVLSASILTIWMLIGGVFVALHIHFGQNWQVLLLLSQTYVVQGVLIFFLVMYGKLHGMYIVSHRTAAQMGRLANTDFLLGVPNRRWIHERLDTLIREASERTPTFSVVLMDIDKFKTINDVHGHIAGDEVLIEMTNLIATFLDDTTFFGRWGGEEFLFVLMDSDAKESYDFAEKIRVSIERHTFNRGRVTASFGVAEYALGETLGSLLQRADKGVYESKEAGRNRVGLATS